MVHQHLSATGAFAYSDMTLETGKGSANQAEDSPTPGVRLGKEPGAEVRHQDGYTCAKRESQDEGHQPGRAPCSHWC